MRTFGLSYFRLPGCWPLHATPWMVGKEAIRHCAKALGLPIWANPTNACLLTRLPFGRPINMTELQRIEEAGLFLLERGYDWVRVRQHGGV